MSKEDFIDFKKEFEQFKKDLENSKPIFDDDSIEFNDFDNDLNHLFSDSDFSYQIEEIIEFNSYGEDFGIGIRKAKTSSTYVDHHGRVEFQYCWDNGKKRDDNSDVSDVYLTFALKANEPQFIRYKKNINA